MAASTAWPAQAGAASPTASRAACWTRRWTEKVRARGSKSISERRWRAEIVRVVLGVLLEQILGNVVRGEEGGERERGAGADGFGLAVVEGGLEGREHGSRILCALWRLVHATREVGDIGLCRDGGVPKQVGGGVGKGERVAAEGLGDDPRIGLMHVQKAGMYPASAPRKQSGQRSQQQ